MQTKRIPQGLLDKIDQISQRFISRRKNKGHKLSLINWEMIYTPKAGGGLELKNLIDMNDVHALKNLTDMDNVLFMKMGCNVPVSPHYLWIRVLRFKYGLALDFAPLNLENKYSSYL